MRNGEHIQVDTSDPAKRSIQDSRKISQQAVQVFFVTRQDHFNVTVHSKRI